MQSNPQTNKQSVMSSLTWKFLERFLVQIISLAVQIVLARVLAKSDFGSIAIMNAIITYLTIFVQAGFATAIVQKKEINNLDISTTLTISLATATIFYLTLFFCSPFVAQYYQIPELETAIKISSISLFLDAIFSIQNAVLEREMRFKPIFFRSLIATLVSGGMGVGLAYAGFGIWSLVAQSIVRSGLLVVIMCFDRKLLFLPKFSLISFKKIFSFTWKILVTNLITSFQDFLRTLIIGKIYSTDDLADYDKAYTYSSYITAAMAQATSSVMLSTFSRKQDDIDELKMMARRTTGLTAFVLFPALLGVVAIAKPLVLVLLTSKWSGCIPYLMLFCVLRIPSSISVIDKQVYYALGKSQIGLYYEIGLNILKVVALLSTVSISTMAIAVSATIVEYIGIVGIFFLSKRVFGYSIADHMKDLFKPLLSAIIMAIAVYCIGFFNWRNWITLIVQIILGVLLYFGLEALLRDKNQSYFFAIVNEKIRQRTAKKEEFTNKL
jgi:teichuronic acid exporter